MTENGRRIELQCLIFILSLCLFIAPSAWGDYQDGRKAYNRGDYTTALKELQPLAEQGHAEAQYLLGYMYYKGQGVVQNGAEAVKWLHKAAEQGDVKAQLRLGMMFRLGSSVSKNYADAEKWLRKATEQGHAKARYNLGLMYYRGEGVDQDDVEGLELIRKAAEQGYASAQTFLSRMNQKLSQMSKIDAPQKNFQILWDEFDRHYVFFESKNINWQALYDIYVPQVTNQTDNSALFDIFSSMLTHLDDVHVTLITPFKNFNSANRRPEGTLNLDFVKSKYLSAGFQTSGDGFFISGPISDAIGYLHIASFSSKNGRAWVKAIDPIVKGIMY